MPFALVVTAPLAPWLTETSVNGLPAGSLSLARTLMVMGVFSAVVAMSLLAIGERLGGTKRRFRPFVITAWLYDHCRFRLLVWPFTSRIPTVAPTPDLAAAGGDVVSSLIAVSKYESRIRLLPSNSRASKITLFVPSPLTASSLFHWTMN